ncbi:hypothetical protein [Flavobacterium soyangense]|uniref:Uncharacterized protein n=1 Tax=Flavobacterium soyangense TaxID=2023265 RepID=A0A930U9R3_9FLAO|nr:hypothetical protein [Flavobacterium soyangense]MBF2707469.1 hypothetical protein [Flavobacterium soyangense]
MKKFTLIALLFCSFTILFAQAPQKMSYQSVIRKTDGTLVVNTLVGIKISILQGSASGTAVYVETQTTTTNANGLATLAIGGGTPVTGTFAGINWTSGTYFIKTETDPTGGTNYTITGTSQLLSVPYALYAGSSQNKGKTSITLTGNITDAQAAAQIAAESGSYTESLYILNTTALTTVNLSTLTNASQIVITNNASLKTVNFSNLTTIGNRFYIQRNPVLSSIGFPSLTYVGFLGVYLSGNALPSSQINTILNKLVTATIYTGSAINLNRQTPSSPPTGQGIIDKQTLINAGIQVSTD